MAATFPADPIGETFEVQVKWSSENKWYTEENGKGTRDQATSWAKSILEANEGIEVKIVRCVREVVAISKPAQPAMIIPTIEIL